MKEFVIKIMKVLSRVFIFIWNRLASILPNELYLKVRFKYNVGYWPNFKTPRTYNEKLQWLKLFDYHPEYTNLVDKIEAKKYVTSLIGEKYVIPTLGIWGAVDDIEWEKLPNKFVIKVTSDSGGVVVCKDKDKLDRKKAIAELKRNWGRNYYKYNKEYPYRDVKPRIIAEKYMEDESGFELKDYKFFCFDGEPKLLFVATGRQMNDTRFDFFDVDFNHLQIINGHPNADVCPSKPQNFEQMLDIARQLSKDFRHVRVDLYNVNGQIYFGELTFFHFSGLVPFVPQKWDRYIGDMINLNN